MLSSRLSDSITTHSNSRISKVAISFLNKLELLTAADKFSGTWKTLVERFSACDLTYESDRLPAIGGLARRMKPLLDCRYLAGLWESELLSQLLWRWFGRTKIPKDEYLAPSWSWAAIPGEVHYDATTSVRNKRNRKFMDLAEVHQCATMKNVEVKTIDGSEMSQAISGYLQLSGSLLPSSIDSVYRIKVRNSLFNFSGDAEFFDDTFDNRTYYSVPLFYYKFDSKVKTEGLVLKHSGEKGQFERVGYFSDIDHLYYDGGDRDLNRHESWWSMIIGRGDDAEKALMTENLYEEYDEGSNRYTFTII